MTEGNVSGVRQLRVSMDVVLLEHDLFGRPNLPVCRRYVMLFLCSCTIFRTGRRLICNGDMELWASLFIHFLAQGVPSLF